MEVETCTICLRKVRMESKIGVAGVVLGREHRILSLRCSRLNIERATRPPRVHLLDDLAVLGLRKLSHFLELLPSSLVSSFLCQHLLMLIVAVVILHLVWLFS